MMRGTDAAQSGPLRAIPNGISVEVLATAGAAQSKVRGLHGGALKVSVRAAPENGKANAEIEALLAAFFGVPKQNVRVSHGLTQRAKRVAVLGVTLPAAELAVRALV